MSKNKINTITRVLSNGGAGVLMTDTIYGLVGSALKPETVERIYKIRERKPSKPMIILIGSLSHLKLFGVKIGKKDLLILNRYWPGKVSVILLCPFRKFEYLHRGAKSLAFRLPKGEKLRELLAKDGPLVAPSANPEGFSPAKNIAEARKYFGDEADFYLGGRQGSLMSSTLISLDKGKVRVLRDGAVKIPV